MAGLQDMLGGLLGILGGGQGGITQMQMQPPQQQQNNQYAGLLNDPELQQLINGQKNNAFYSGLLQAGQPSKYKTSFMQALGQGQQAANQAGTGFNDALINARVKQMTPQWKETKDAFGNPLVYNETDPSQTKPLTGGSNPFGSQTGTQATAGQPQVSGDEYLQTLDPKIGAQVKGIAEGKIPFPSGMALKTPYWQQMLSAVSQYDPKFDAVNYNARNKTRTDFTSGASSNNINALNTAMAHASSLQDAYSNLDNSDYPSMNTAKNWVGNAIGNQNIQSNTADVSAKGHALSEELAKVFRSTGMAESDVRSWEEKLSANATPAQSKATLSAAMDLMDGRLNALGEKYNQGMGTSKQGIELLSPEAQKAYKKVRGMSPGVTNAGGQQTNQPAQNQPPQAAIQMLRSNPALAPAFEAKYGIPSGSFLTNGGASGGF